MKLTKQELEILGNIQEGLSDTKSLKTFTEIDWKKIKVLLEKLEKEGLVKINKKYDNYYKEDYWQAHLTEKGKKELK